MRASSKRRLRFAVGIAALALLIAIAALAAMSHTGGSAAAAGHMTPFAGDTAKWQAIGSPQAGPGGSVHFGCQLTVPAGCYGPDQMRAAYSVDSLIAAGKDGTGRTIGIVDAYGSPTLASDLALFNSTWGLPAANLQVLTPFGIDATSPDNADGWSGETTLDVEWAHAIAPGAKIVLVIAKSNDDKDILDATEWLGSHTAADTLSQSYGEAEQCMDPAQLARQHVVFDKLSAQGVTIFASSGDQGAGIPACSGDLAYFKAASTPASDPDVTGVGGTTLHADGRSGAYQSEATWNESWLGDAIAGGGGVSVLFKRPDFQAPFVKDTHAREVPDVSYNAAIFNGVIVAWGGGFCALRRDERRLAAVGGSRRDHRPDRRWARRSDQQDALQAREDAEGLVVLPRRRRRLGQHRAELHRRLLDPGCRHRRLHRGAGLRHGHGPRDADRQQPAAGDREAGQRLSQPASPCRTRAAFGRPSSAAGGWKTGSRDSADAAGAPVW